MGTPHFDGIIVATHITLQYYFHSQEIPISSILKLGCFPRVNFGSEKTLQFVFLSVATLPGEVCFGDGTECLLTNISWLPPQGLTY